MFTFQIFYQLKMTKTACFVWDGKFSKKWINKCHLTLANGGMKNAWRFFFFGGGVKMKLWFKCTVWGYKENNETCVDLLMFLSCRTTITLKFYSNV